MVQVVTGDSQEEVIIFRDKQTDMHHNIYISITIINNKIPTMQLTLHGQSNDIGDPLALGVCNTASVVSGVLAFNALYLYYCICLPICIFVWLEKCVCTTLPFNQQRLKKIISSLQFHISIMICGCDIYVWFFFVD